MPQKHAAIKDLRKNQRRAAHNARIKKNVKSLFKKTTSLITESKKTEAAEAARAFQQAADKATKVGVLTKNTAARKKSQLMKAISKK